MTRRARIAGSKYNEDGLTLIELLIAMVVLGVLSGVVIVAMGNLTPESLVAACKADYATAQEAVDAYRVQMGGYPGGTGSAVVTDSDPGLAPGFVAGTAPQGVNAARSGGELLRPGGTAPNTSGSTSVGSWLRQAPIEVGSFAIWVANDGSGAVQVLNGSGHVPTSPTQSANDCASLSTNTPSTALAVGATSTTTPSTTTPTSRPVVTTTTAGQPLLAPKFVSAASTTFHHGVHGAFSVLVTGHPAPTVRVVGSLPLGITFNSLTDVLSGTARNRATAHVTLMASNGVGSTAKQRFTFVVG